MAARVRDLGCNNRRNAAVYYRLMPCNSAMEHNYRPLTKDNKVWRLQS
jgi:hypothetical protein